MAKIKVVGDAVVVESAATLETLKKVEKYRPKKLYLYAEDGKTPSTQSNVRIVMPPQGFLAAFNSMQQLIDKLLEAGVLQKNEAAKDAKK